MLSELRVSGFGALGFRPFMPLGFRAVRFEIYGVQGLGLAGTS